MWTVALAWLNLRKSLHLRRLSDVPCPCRPFIQRDNGSIDLLGDVSMLWGQLADRLNASPTPQFLAVSHVLQEKGYTFQTRGLFIFPLKVTRGIQRSDPGRGHVCWTKSHLFPESWIVLTDSPAVSSKLGMFPQGLCINTHSGYSISWVCLWTKVKKWTPVPKGHRFQTVLPTNRWRGTNVLLSPSFSHSFTNKNRSYIMKFKQLLNLYKRNFSWFLSPHLFYWHKNSSIASQIVSSNNADWKHLTSYKQLFFLWLWATPSYAKGWLLLGQESLLTVLRRL